MKLKTQNSKLKTGFKYLPNIATADVAFEAYGTDYSELFENAGLALEETMVDTKTIDVQTGKKIKLQDTKIENLLFSFLEELVYLKDAEGLVFKEIKCRLDKQDNQWAMEAVLKGEKLDKEKQDLRNDVKAVTKHLFEIRNLPKGAFQCRVVLDV